MIVTTALKNSETLAEEAKRVASELKVSFVQRRGRSIAELVNEGGEGVFVVGSKYAIYRSGEGEPLFFHPNVAMLRVKRFLKGEKDPFLIATKLTDNMSFLDCTLGLASDSILASVIVGKNGQVVGVEANRFVAYLVTHGLTNYASQVHSMDEALRRIKVVHCDHLTFLRSQKDDQFDVVYFDPMFETKVKESSGIESLRFFAFERPLTEEVIVEAKRVAKQRIVLKDHWQSERFRQFGFQVYKRPTALFHYATIEL